MILIDGLGYLLYMAYGKKPFTKGYAIYKKLKILEILHRKEFDSKQLKKGYGLRLDERIVEYPWFFSRLPLKEGRLLDAGSVLNFDFIITHQSLLTKNIFISTFAPEKKCFWNKGISYIYEDIREICYKGNFFDWIVSLSVFEHIGLDNTKYYTNEKSKNENNLDSYLMVVKEFHRILKPEGVLYLSVPFGKYKNHGWLQIFNAKMIDAILETFSPSSYMENHFRYDSEGWHISSRIESAESTYFDYHEEKDRYNKDCSVAARSVVCLELVK